jgi:hypothetical protein
MESEKNYHGGRPPRPIRYTDIEYNGKIYTVGTILNIQREVYFIIDKEARLSVEKYNWHLQTEKYIGAQVKIDGNTKVLYLHNLIMRREKIFPGKGAKETIDHINRIGFDNRKENLRILTQSEQNINQIKRERSITLPEGCEINPEDIPRHIWYIKAQGAHGDRFAIEFKSEGLCWKTTSSKKISLKNKLLEAKEKLQEFYNDYPHLNPFDTNKLALEESLKKSYEEILALANRTE